MNVVLWQMKITMFVICYYNVALVSTFIYGKTKSDLLKVSTVLLQDLGLDNFYPWQVSAPTMR